MPIFSVRFLWFAPAGILLLTGAPCRPAPEREQQDRPQASRTDETSPPAKQMRAAYAICVDPGHSKKTLGARYKDVYEYQICWQIAKKLETRLQQQHVTVWLTRQSAEQDVETEQRALLANAHHVDLFLRLHCDAGADSGVATFYPDTQGTAKGKTGPEPEVLASSRRCAYALHPALLKSLGKSLRDRGIRTDRQTYVGSQQGGALTGSIFSNVPVVLVEMCVLTNPRDAAFIRSPTGQNKMADALAAGAIAAIEANRKTHAPAAR